MEALKDLKLVHNTTALVSALFAALQKYRVYEIKAEQSEMQMKAKPTTNETENEMFLVSHRQFWPAALEISGL